LQQKAFQITIFIEMKFVAIRIVFPFILLLFSGYHSNWHQQSPKKTTIPLKQAGRLFLIEATINGKTGNFVLDTGSTSLVLNKTYFRQYNRTQQSSGGISGTNEVSGSIQVKELIIGDIVLRNLVADVANLGQIENQKQVRILGLIGMMVFKQFEMHLDLRMQNLELLELDQSGMHNIIDSEPFTPDIICPVVLRNDIMFIQGSVSGQDLDFCLDTGAETNVICSSCRKDVLSSVKITRRTNLTGVGGRSADVLLGAMTDFTLAETKFHPMQTIVTSLAALSSAYSYPVDGVLGYDFFVRGKIRINLVRQEFSIKFY
jgi:predicted aspartyl protease